jgi:hypothetical protein
LLPSPDSAPSAAVASFAQQRRVHALLNDPGGPLTHAAKNVPMAAWVPRTVDVDALTAAIQALVARHPALQYRFVPRRDEVLLRRAVRDAPEIPLTIHDPIPGAEHDPTIIRDAVREAIDVPFDILGWPLLRAGLIPGARSMVYLSFDHTVADGYSTKVAFQELESLYRALVDGRPTDLPPTGDYVAYSANERRRYAGGVELDRSVDEMRSLLRGRPIEPEFPLPVTDWDATRGRYAYPDLVDAEAAGRLADYCRAHRVSPYMVVLAAFGVAAREIADRAEVGVLASVHNRDAANVGTRGIGWYANMLPLYFSTFPVERFDEGIQMLRNRLMAVLSYAELPLARLADRLADSGQEGAGLRTPTCFISFEQARLDDPTDPRAWELLELAPTYRMGYGVWAAQDGNGIRAVMASPASRRGEPELSQWEQRLGEVLTTVAGRARLSPVRGT